MSAHDELVTATGQVRAGLAALHQVDLHDVGVDDLAISAELLALLVSIATKARRKVQHELDSRMVSCLPGPQ